MSLPKKAILEAVLPGNIAIYDVSHLLPKPRVWRFNKRPRGTKIQRLFFHHSGRYGKDGYKGAYNSIKYTIRERDFGARAYHFWLSYKPDKDNVGNIVIYRLAPDAERAWHTGQKANDNGLGIAFQGNLSPGNTGKPSSDQIKMAEALVNWNIERHNITLPNGLSFHSEAKKWGAKKNKASCPGPYVVKWVKERRERIDDDFKKAVNEISPKKPPAPATEPDNIKNTKITKPKRLNGWFGRVPKSYLKKIFGK